MYVNALRSRHTARLVGVSTLRPRGPSLNTRMHTVAVVPGSTHIVGSTCSLEVGHLGTARSTTTGRRRLLAWSGPFVSGPRHLWLTAAIERSPLVCNGFTARLILQSLTTRTRRRSAILLRSFMVGFLDLRFRQRKDSCGMAIGFFRRDASNRTLDASGAQYFHGVTLTPPRRGTHAFTRPTLNQLYEHKRHSPTRGLISNWSRPY